MEGGILYMHHKSGSLNLSLSLPPSLRTSPPYRETHTHKHHTSRNQADRERQRREGRAGPQRKKGKQASKHLGNGVLSISIHTQGEGGQGLRTKTTRTPRPLAFCFYCHLIQFICATPFLWSFFLFFLFSYTLVSRTVLFCLLPSSSALFCA